MATLNPLASLFGGSPIKPMQEHMALALDTAEKLPEFFEMVMKNDWIKAAEIQKQINESEEQADNKKKEIRLHMPKSLFLPVARSDLLELLAMQDSVANSAKDIAGLILGRKMVMPTQIQAEMKVFVASSVKTVEQAMEVIHELDELLEIGFSGGRELQLVEKMIEELDSLEHMADDHEVTIRASLFAIEKELAPVDVMFLYQTIDDIGQLADRAQKVGSRLLLLLAR